MDYTKSSDQELGVVIEHCKWVEGTEIRYQISDIRVGTGSNNSSNEHIYAVAAMTDWH